MVNVVKCFIFGALYLCQSKSGLMNKHTVRHTVKVSKKCYNCFIFGALYPSKSRPKYTNMSWNLAYPEIVKPLPLKFQSLKAGEIS